MPRPTLPKSRRRSVVVRLRVTPKEGLRIAAAARRAKQTVADWLRAQIAETIDGK